MASFYLQALRHVQPKGPYRLGGASGGAIISFEMARQLIVQGELIELVALLDGWVPHPDKLRNPEFFEAAMRRQYHMMRSQFLSKGITKAEHLLDLQWQRAKLLDNYRFTRLGAPLTLFKAMQVNSVYQPYDAPFNHWDKYSTFKVIRHQTPGDHETMFQEPHVKILAEKLLDCLQELRVFKIAN